MEQTTLSLLMNNITFFGTFEQHNYISGKDIFVVLWDKLNFNLYKNDTDYLIEIPVSILTITTLQSSVNLVLGLRTIYSKNRQRINLHFTTDNIESYYNIQLLPESFVDLLEYTWAFMLSKMADESKPYAGFNSHELTQLELIIEYMKQGNNLSIDYLETQRKLFYQNILQIDKNQNSNFCEIFPYLLDFYKECKKI